MYREWASRIGGAVCWHSTAEQAGVDRVLPDGCMDLLWDGVCVRVAGPDDRAQLSSADVGDRFVGLRLAPGQGPHVVGAPASSLLNQRVELSSLWPRDELRTLCERLDACTSPQRVASELELAALAALRRSPVDPQTTRIARLAGAGASTSAIADELGVTERSVHRRSVAAFGYGPAQLRRILRLQRALHLAHDGATKAAAAALAGYADQAHLSRDARDLAGATLGELLR